jgi:hypothetical protein
MQPESQNHTTFDSPTVDIPTGSAHRLLRSSLEQVFRDVQLSADLPPENRLEVRAALRHVCAVARRSGMRAEQLLVLIKDVWSCLPAGISRVQSVHGDERLAFVITACVDEYYGVSAPERAGVSAPERAGVSAPERASQVGDSTTDAPPREATP